MVKGEHDFLNFRKTSDFWKFSEQGFPEVDKEEKGKTKRQTW